MSVALIIAGRTATTLKYALFSLHSQEPAEACRLSFGEEGQINVKREGRCRGNGIYIIMKTNSLFLQSREGVCVVE